MSTTYRPDIDGLRTVAVLPVVLFHLGFEIFGGGYVGVDVFFVISGYLISGILWRDMQRGRFSLRDFYERRARRILPVLFVVLTLTGLAGLAVLTPAELDELGETLLGAVFFVSNLVLYLQSGYFDAASHAKPLLHTWSLAVEEQFYIFFPLILWALLRFAGERAARWAIPAIIVTTFAATLWILPKDTSLAFYATPLRAWELLAGAFLAIWTPRRLPGAANHAVSVLGLGLILGPVFLYTAETRFPGLTALPPVLGAALLIWAGPGALAGRLLALRPFVGVGLISYSLYMWHWPMIVLPQLVLIRPLGLVEQLGLLALMLAVSWLSWKYIEGPFRKPTGLLKTSRGVFAASGAALLSLSVLGALFVGAQGLPGRFPAPVLQIARTAEEVGGLRQQCPFETQLSRTVGFCHLGPEGPPRVLVWGDSHAAALYPMMETLLQQQDMPGEIVANYGCPPVLNLVEPDTPHCAPFAQRILDRAIDQGVEKIILVGIWRGALLTKVTEYQGRPGTDRDSRRANVTAALTDMIASLQGQGIDVAVMMPVPGSPYSVPEAMFRQAVLPLPGTNRGELRRTEAYYADLTAPLRAGATRADLVLEVAPLLCAEGSCAVETGGQPLYRDTNHPSHAMNRLLLPVLGPQISSFINRDASTFAGHDRS
ncbi:O-acetyltransferase OatA [Pseudooceanicola marinus]|uniref:O-acetyltransferase OatA n=1 Tax=Pseudooceanicola marinus TaxID=396013 RepID=A0A1X7AB01_9RHOB|nr:acyltransferase family protein [Pseudooceanicola marinus]SLN74522.1 O-acetyltransferase OatA [Pseudooceanicola marinus]